MNSFDIPRARIESAIQSSPWALCDDTLYALCQEHPDHRKADEILAKVFMIGRVYAASLERRKNADLAGANFFEDIVVPIIQNSEIDSWFASLRALPSPSLSEQRVDAVLRVHDEVTRLFARISGQQNRSLAARYLHCHFPGLFYLFDLRSSAALRRYISKRSFDSSMQTRREFADPQYERFYLDCEALNSAIGAVLGRTLSPQELDKVLSHCLFR